MEMHLTAPLLNKPMNLYASYKEMHHHKTIYYSLIQMKNKNLAHFILAFIALLTTQLVLSGLYVAVLIHESA